MKMKAFLSVAAFGFLVLAGCSEDKDLTGFNSDCTNLLGTFTATKATVTPTEGSGSAVNLLADSSMFQFAFANSGSFSSTYRIGAHGTPTMTSGTLNLQTPTEIGFVNTTLFPGAGASTTFNCSISGNTLTLDATASTYQFNGAAVGTPARTQITLTRTSD